MHGALQVSEEDFEKGEKNKANSAVIRVAFGANTWQKGNHKFLEKLDAFGVEIVGRVFRVQIQENEPECEAT